MCVQLDLVCDSSSYFKENVFQGLALKEFDRFRLEILKESQRRETGVWVFQRICKAILTLKPCIFCLFVCFVFFCAQVILDGMCQCVP